MISTSDFSIKGTTQYGPHTGYARIGNFSRRSDHYLMPHYLSNPDGVLTGFQPQEIVGDPDDEVAGFSMFMFPEELGRSISDANQYAIVHVGLTEAENKSLTQILYGTGPRDADGSYYFSTARSDATCLPHPGLSGVPAHYNARVSFEMSVISSRFMGESTFGEWYAFRLRHLAFLPTRTPDMGDDESYNWYGAYLPTPSFQVKHIEKHSSKVQIRSDYGQFVNEVEVMIHVCHQSRSDYATWLTDTGIA